MRRSSNIAAITRSAAFGGSQHRGQWHRRVVVNNVGVGGTVNEQSPCIALIMPPPKMSRVSSIERDNESRNRPDKASRRRRRRRYMPPDALNVAPYQARVWRAWLIYDAEERISPPARTVRGCEAALCLAVKLRGSAICAAGNNRRPMSPSE